MMYYLNERVQNTVEAWQFWKVYKREGGAFHTDVFSNEKTA